MEAEYVAISTACEDLFPIINTICALASSVDLSVDAISNMHIKVHEDNVGVLTLAGLEPYHMTPCSKHYAIKHHWLGEHVQAHHIKLVKIASADQLADLFTKGLLLVTFTHLQSLLIGW
jgi:hypothetical protein